MFKKWLNENKIADFSFSTRLFPKADDREFWGNTLNEDHVKHAEEYLGYAWPLIRASQYMEFQKSGSRLAQDGIVLDYQDNDQEIPEISCDPKRLRQVFLNILDNAAKHGSDGKRIETSICYDADTVVVRIRDFGPGIPEDELPLVKKKFYKGSSKARGSGIGLAVCEEIVAMHGGSLQLDNAEGGGTVVTVMLPASQ